MPRYRMEYGYDTDAEWTKIAFGADTDEAAAEEARKLNRRLGGTYAIQLYKVKMVEETKVVRWKK